MTVVQVQIKCTRTLFKTDADQELPEPALNDFNDSFNSAASADCLTSSFRLPPPCKYSTTNRRMLKHR
jgi:hypothetical protein